MLLGHGRPIVELQCCQVPPHQRDRITGAVDEGDVRGAPRECLDAEGPAAGEQVEHSGAIDSAQAAEGIEQRLADPVGRRADPLVGGGLQTTTPMGAGNDSHNGDATGALPGSARATATEYPLASMDVVEEIICVDCGGPCYLLSRVPEDGWHAGDIATYRCRDCNDRWDLELDDDGVVE